MRRLHHSLAAFRHDVVLAEVLDDARAGVLGPVPAPTIEPRRQVPQLLAVAPYVTKEGDEYRCDHVAKKPEKCCGRVGNGGVVASEACPKTCGTC